MFRDVVAAEDLTLAALSAALVIATGKEHKPRTVIDLFNSAGFHTYWISNQHNHGSFFDTGICDWCSRQSLRFGSILRCD